MLIVLALSNYIQSKEIKKLKRLFNFDEQDLIDEAIILQKNNSNKVNAVKILREMNYPLDLIDAKRIVDIAEIKIIN